MPTVAIKGHQQHRDMVINYTVHSEKRSERAIRISLLSVPSPLSPCPTLIQLANLWPAAN